MFAAKVCRELRGISLVLLLVTAPAEGALVGLSFEDLPDSKLFLDGGENIGDFYATVTFGPDVTALSSSRLGYNDEAFPASSGDTVIFSAFWDEIEITFNTPASLVSFWYTSFDPLEVSFFGAMGTLLGTTFGTPNTDGVFGVSDFLEFDAGGFLISRVLVLGFAGSYVLDDLTFTQETQVPEPTSVALMVLGLAIGGAVGRHRLHRSNGRQPRR